MRLAVPKKFTSDISRKKDHLLGAAGAHSLPAPHSGGSSSIVREPPADLISERTF